MLGSRSRLRFLKQAIDRQPRISLGRYPTPLYKLHQASKELGIELYIKREDLSGPAFGLSGNKTRMLEFRMARALEEGSDTIVSGFDTNSNHARQVAAAAQKLGLDAKLWMRPVDVSSSDTSENLILTCLLGAEVNIVNVDASDHLRLLEDKAASLSKSGKHPFLTGWNDEHISAVAYADCGIELLQQCTSLGIKPETLFLCSAGATQAGLALCFKYANVPITVQGVNHADWISDAPRNIATIANKAAELLGLDCYRDTEYIHNTKDFVGSGHKKTTDEILDAVAFLARTEGIIIEPTYTGRAMAALLRQVKNRDLEPHQVVVFLHSGGGPLLFSYREQWSAWVRSRCVYVRNGQVRGETQGSSFSPNWPLLGSERSE